MTLFTWFRVLSSSIATVTFPLEFVERLTLRRNPVSEFRAEAEEKGMIMEIGGDVDVIEVADSVEFLVDVESVLDLLGCEAIITRPIAPAIMIMTTTAATVVLVPIALCPSTNSIHPCDPDFLLSGWI